jgi:hypothetical protein
MVEIDTHLNAFRKRKAPGPFPISTFPNNIPRFVAVRGDLTLCRDVEATIVYVNTDIIFLQPWELKGSSDYIRVIIFVDVHPEEDT